MSQPEAIVPDGPMTAAPPGQGVGARAWVALGALWFIYVLNFLDRQLLSILAIPRRCGGK